LASLLPARITRDQRDHWLGSAHIRRGLCAEPPKSTSVFAVVTKSGSSSVDGYIAVAVAQGVSAALTQSLQSAGPPQNPAEMKDRRHGKHAQRNQDCDLQIYPLRLPTPRYQSKSRVARRRESELREFGSGASPSPTRFFRRVILARMRRPKIFDFEPVPQLFDLVVRIRYMPKEWISLVRLRADHYTRNYLI
jgi:hypothetical protein